MAQILNFPTRNIARLVVRSGPRHRIIVEVIDNVRPKFTRWMLQFAVQNAAGFQALDGLKDIAVAAGYRHRFTITKMWLLRRFLAQTADLIADGLVLVKVDGVVVEPRIRRRA